MLEWLLGSRQTHEFAHLVAPGLIADATREWHPNVTSHGDSARRRSGSWHHAARNAKNGECTELLRRHGLCDPALLHVPQAHAHYDGNNRHPFMFLHLSKCAGTSLINTISLGQIGLFTREERQVAATSCESGTSNKCCWWRERIGNMSRGTSRRLQMLVQEPANTMKWVDDRGLVVHVEPGFDFSRDFCAKDLAYVTVLRPPVERVHSHMCEIGATFGMWQDAADRRPGHVKKQLRDNYFVRSLGGTEAWNSPEGRLQLRHLHAAARTLARFDVVMTVGSIDSDAPIQMSRVGLPGFRWRREFERSRADNLKRATTDVHLQTRGGMPSCNKPPTAEELRRLVAACTWDAVLYEFAALLAARRTAVPVVARGA